MRADFRKRALGQDRSLGPMQIDLPAASFDVIFCFDVLEHIMDYRDIVPEWHRVVRPRRQRADSLAAVLAPVRPPRERLVPIPWAHVLLNGRELREVCARIVDWPEFQESVWDRNADGSRRNRFREQDAGEDFLNKLTVREFEGVWQGGGVRVRSPRVLPVRCAAAREVH